MGRIRMWPFDPPADHPPSGLWMWGFWVCMGIAVPVFVLSLQSPPPVDRILRIVAGVLFIVGGLHEVHVVKYKVKSRGPYSTFGPHAYILARQTGWSAMVLGAFFIATAVVGL